MDKKTKKRITVLRARLAKLRQQLAGARQQCDDPEEVVEIERSMAAAEKELESLVEK